MVEECPVCMEATAQPQFPFSCGHPICRICSRRMSLSELHRCPTCRAPREGMTAAQAAPREEPLGEIRPYASLFAPSLGTRCSRFRKCKGTAVDRLCGGALMAAGGQTHVLRPLAARRGDAAGHSVLVGIAHLDCRLAAASAPARRAAAPRAQLARQNLGQTSPSDKSAFYLQVQRTRPSHHVEASGRRPASATSW